ncbi:MAG: ABC transporter permease subunit [Pseudomonadota bacterium]
MTEGAEHTATRSLTATAWARLTRNRTAMVSLSLILAFVVAGLAGPSLWPHDYAEVYRDYVRTPASLTPHPRDEALRPAAEDALRRARAEITEARFEGDTAHLTLEGRRALDPRTARLLERSDVFANPRVLSHSEDRRTLVLEADIVRHTFALGTDANGRDLAARILIGLRISLMIGALASVVALVIGVAYGAVAGFVGGRLDGAMMRVVDVLYALPFIFFVILLVVFFGRSVVLMFIAVGCIEWLDMARIVRGQTLSLRRREFVAAAEALGVTPTAILLRHIVPNLAGTVIVYLTLLIPKVILLESFLSFLGLGVQEPLTSLGVLIAEGAANMRNAPHMLLWPALALTALLFALNLLGDGLRDALDPKR